jgi:vitamin B12 transporter
MPAFILVNLNADFRIARSLQVYGRVENAFDRHYEEVYGFVAPARAAYAGIKASL